MNTKKPVTLFNYIGGKTWLRKELRESVEKIIYKNKFTCYSEPFAGGLGAFLNVYDILLENNINNIILNDINHRVINFYKIVLNKPQELIMCYIELERNYLKTIPQEAFELHKIKDKEKLKILLSDSGLFFNKIRNNFNKEQTPVENASNLLFLQLHCFNGVYRENLKGDYNTPYNWEIRKIDEDVISKRIWNVHNILNKFTINFTNMSYEKIKFNNETLYYLDPPYLNDGIAENKYSKNGFGLNEQKKLISLLYNTHFVYSNHYNNLLIDEFNFQNIKIDIKQVSRKNIISSSANSRKNDKIEMLISSV